MKLTPIHITYTILFLYMLLISLYYIQNDKTRPRIISFIIQFTQSSEHFKHI